MPQYEFNNKETGESVGEIFLSLEGLEDFLAMNPNLCVAPGKLRYLADKSDEAFPSYPDMNNHTRTREERGDDFKPADPATWNDSNEDSGKTGYKVVDKRKNKISHFDEDIKKYGRIVSAPRMLGEGSATNFHVDKIDCSDPITDEEEDQYNAQLEKENSKLKQQKYEHDRGMRGTSSKNAINLDLGSQQLNPWEKGYAKQNAEQYKDLK